VRKEVRLYGLVFALAGLYAIGWISLWLARADALIAGQSFAAFTAMYGAFVALLVGAISTAEERSLGTFETQILLPWSFWKKLLVKLVTISLLALLLGLVVPMGLEAAFPLIDNSGRVGPRLPFYLWLPFGAAGSSSVTILLVTLFSAYASTLCSGGLRGLLVASSLSFGLASLFRSLVYATYNLKLVTHSFNAKSVMVRFLWQGGWVAGNWADLRMAGVASEWTHAATFVGFVAAILYLYSRNSRSAEPGLSFAKKQIPWIVVYVAIAGVLVSGSEAFFEWWLLTH
jgi:hypothetical protein